MPGASLAVVVALATPCVSRIAGETAFLLQSALLIDGTGSPPRSAIDILIKGGRVAGVGPTGAFPAADGVRVLDASGKTVIPGFINIRGLAGLVRSPDYTGGHFTREETLAALRAYASYGITTTTTPGPDSAVLSEIGEGVRSGRIGSAARLLSPLRILTVSAANHGGSFGVERVFEVMHSVRDARLAVERLADEGADYLEVRMGVGGKDRDRCIAVAVEAVESAARRGLPVAVATPEQSAASALVRAGARVLTGSVTDGSVTDAFVALLLETNTVYAPALGAEAARFEFGDEATWLDDRYLRRSLPSGVTGLLRGPVRMRQALDPDRSLRIRRYDTARRNLRRLADAGVMVGLASGSGVEGTFEGFSEYLEAVRMRRAGLSAMRVIRASTYGSANALGIESERGLVKPGYFADLVILNGNPLESIHSLRELHAVFVGGQLAKL